MNNSPESAVILPTTALALVLAALLGCSLVPAQPEQPPSGSPTVGQATVSPSPAPPSPFPSPVPSPLPPPSPTSTPPTPATPSPPPAVESPATATQPPGIALWEATLTLSTYGWEQALRPTDPEDALYPYPRLDFGAVSGPAPREYRAVFVQNDQVQLVVLPDLGGRILRWTDRSAGRQLFYANPVVKPTHWGYRGWWLATGGMEWAFPTEEHGLVEWRAWEYQLLADGIRLWTTDDRTGLAIQVTVRLEPDSSRVVISPRISNPTGRAQPFQFWANAMLTLSDSNTPSEALTFVLPASRVILHSTGDGSLPGPGGSMGWPVYAGRDFSRYAEWHSYMGVFAPEAAQAGFAGAYDLASDQGVVRVAPTWLQGVKVFCLGDLPSDLWTDDSSRYFELWGGLTPTFWDYTSLGPGESVAWTEYWYAVSGMGGYTCANEEAAARLTPTGDGVEVAVQTVRPLEASVILQQEGFEVARWTTGIGPGHPLRAHGGSGGGPWTLELADSEGQRLLRCGP